MNMREKMARRLCEIEGMDPDREALGMGHMMQKDYSGPAWAGRLHTIDALLDALTEPTEGMIKAGANTNPSDPWPFEREVWSAMIRAAKEGK